MVVAPFAAPESAATEPYFLIPYGWSLRVQVSRDPPPPLPNGYKLGDKVFYTGTSQTFPTGDKLVHGQQGEVVGPVLGEIHKGKGVAVRFPGNKGNIGCFLTSGRRLSRVRSPPLPRSAPHTRRCMRTPRAAVPPLDPTPAASFCCGVSAGAG